MGINKLFIGLLIYLFSFSIYGETIIDEYNFRMTLKIPQVFNNTESLGYRKYQNQIIKGELKIIYKDGVANEIQITNLVNNTFKINKVSVSYNSLVSDEIYPRLSYIGNNKTNKFKTPNILFYLVADPSYNISGGVDEDNSLYLLCAGKGNTLAKAGKGSQVINYLSGYATGSLGCGCSAYTHLSPTRLVGPFSFVDGSTDVAAVLGSWVARWKRRIVVSN